MTQDRREKVIIVVICLSPNLCSAVRFVVSEFDGICQSGLCKAPVLVKRLEVPVLHVKNWVIAGLTHHMPPSSVLRFERQFVRGDTWLLLICRFGREVRVN